MTVGSSGALDPQGPVAETMADLWWLMLAIGTVVFVLVAALLAGGLLRRRPAEGDEPAGADGAGDGQRRFGRWLVGGGIVLPVVVLVVVFGATVEAMRDVPDEAPAGALEVELVGHQWWWEVRYPEHGVTTANELHLPVGRPVAVRMTSADVIHSFWVPVLGGKLDLLPDGVNTLVIQADEPGEHRSECAEFCGLQHAKMALAVVAEPPEQFEAWAAAQAEPAAEPVGAEAERGREVFLRSRCAECHAIQGTAAAGTDGPDLTHVASRPTLGAGSVPNTAEELAAWIADPHDAKEGVEMPAGLLDDEELAAVVAYLEGLE